MPSASSALHRRKVRIIRLLKGRMAPEARAVLVGPVLAALVAVDLAAPVVAG